MDNYVITKRNTYVVDNEVFFAGSLKEAGELVQNLVQETNDEWVIAAILH